MAGTVTDATVTTVTMSVDGADPVPLSVTDGAFSRDLTFTVQKTYTITVSAADQAGNNSIVVRHIIFDTTSAVTTAEPPGGTYDMPQGVSLSCVDAGSNCASTKYCLGSGCTDWITYTGEIIPVSNYAVLRFFSTDSAGNVEDVRTETYIFTHTLTLSAGGSGSGTVAGGGVYAYGTTHDITATADQGSTFVGWSGDCTGTASPLSVTMPDRDISCTATFTINTYSVSITKTGTGSGTVTSDPTGINCGTDCSESYQYQTSVTLTATPASPASAFMGWSGGGCSGTAPCTISVDGDTAVSAIFDLNSITVAVPNGGEKWLRGRSYTITWAFTGNPGASVKIDLYKAGKFKSTISASTPIGSNGSGSYTWAIPANQQSGSDYTIKITSTSNSSFTDTSNARFSIN